MHRSMISDLEFRNKQFEEFKLPLYDLEEGYRELQLIVKGMGEERVNTQPVAKQVIPADAMFQSFDCTTIEDVPQSECNALVTFYNSTNGAGWTDNSNWLVTKTVESWFGVTVSTGKVTNISLQLNGLTGSIPAQLSNLSSLQGLFLGGNQLTGSIPPELGSLSSLVDLHIWGNQLSGTIPAELGSLGKLEYLLLQENEISGTIPTELGGLSSLVFLGLNSNQLTGSIPPELGGLSNLQLLELSNNLLNGTIPPEFGNLINLWALVLRNNQLNGSIPLTFTKLINLSGFAYNNTGICEPNDDTFQAWKSTVGTWEGTGYRCELSVFLPIIMNSKPVTYQTVPFGLYVNPYFELTFDTSKWEAGPLRLGNEGYYHLFSLTYPNCYIDDLWEHGTDPSRFYPVDSYETHANISFHFQIYYRTGTTNPAFSIIKWGPGEKYVIQIVSVDSINSDWSCFNEGKEVLWRSAERGFN